ncbi:MAG TPA: hypothetical protein VG013_19600 [Gemmataceae bacterium]|jgi:hypothetical protein|nr:hypothetical protein [Gemmataceae bacterium]
MIWQLILVALLVTAAACYLARAAWRTWTGSKSGCGGGCSCGPKQAAPTVKGQGTLIPSEQLSMRLRRSAPRRPD